MRYVLFSDEERRLIEYLRGDLGLTGLGTTVDGHIPEALPTFGQDTEREWLFWCSELGPVLTLGDAPEPTDAVDRVARVLNQEASVEWRQAVDVSRTPVLRWRRAAWHGEHSNCLIPGRMASMAVPALRQPDELTVLLKRVQRWLAKRGLVVDPFQHSPDLPVKAPASRGPFRITLWPQAQEWLQAGGHLWPWDS